MDEIEKLHEKIEQLELEIKIERSNLLSIEKQLKKLQLYTDKIPASLLVLDHIGNIEFINNYGIKILGRGSKEECLGKNWFDEFIPERIKEEIRFVFEKIINGDLTPVEFYKNPVKTKFGIEKEILWRNSYLEDENGEIVYTVGLGFDIESIQKFIKIL